MAGTGLVSSGEKQLIRLGTRLVVGINMHDTILHFPFGGHRLDQYRMRPYLKYFASVLHAFRVDVVLFAGFVAEDHHHTLARLRRELAPLDPYFCSTPVTRQNTLNHDMVGRELEKRAVKSMTVPGRILFVDSEADVKYHLTQTLVLEKFVPVTRLRNADKAPESLPEQKKLALTMNDYTLVALAEMIKDIAASNIPQDIHARNSGVPQVVVGPDGKPRLRKTPLGIAVDDYLRLEPLVEKVNVPMHGVTNYLPIENCDHMDELDLAKLEISEPLEHIEETEEHANMFK